MTKDKLANLLEQAAKSGALLTKKHNPDELSTTHPTPRTVIAAELAPKLPEFLASLDFEVTQYENTAYPKTPDFWEIRPTTTKFLIPASGVPPHSATPTSQCDRLIVVSGSNKGLHIFGESHAEIERRLRAGELRNPHRL
jgi:hypothetical protein